MQVLAITNAQRHAIALDAKGAICIASPWNFDATDLSLSHQPVANLRQAKQATTMLFLSQGPGLGKGKGQDQGEGEG